MGDRSGIYTKGAIPAQKRAVVLKMESVLGLAAVIGTDVEKQVTWLQSKGLLRPAQPAANRWTCSTGVTSPTYRWRCLNSSCKKSISLRSGTFFEQSRLQLWQWIVLMYWWAKEYPVTDTAEEAEVDKKTAIQIYQYCRDICSWRLLNHDSPLNNNARW